MRTFTAELEKGVPKDESQLDSYLQRTKKHRDALVMWLAEFRRNFGDYEDAQATIRDVETVVANYKLRLGAFLRQDEEADVGGKEPNEEEPVVSFLPSYLFSLSLQ